MRDSLPFDGRGGLAGDVVDHAIDAADLVDDAARDGAENFVRQAAPVGGHEVLGFDRADGDGVVVGAAIAHHAHGLDGEERGKDLAGLAVEIGGDDLLEDDLIAGAEQVELGFGHFTKNANGKAGAGEGVTPDELLGEAEDFAEAADFIFEEIAEGLDKLEAKILGEATDVVVQFDPSGLARVAVAAFDDIGVQGALGQERSTFDVGRGGLEDFDEAVADAAALFLRISDAGKISEELAAGIDDAEVDLEMVAESGLDQVALAGAEQAGIDKDAVQLRADGLVQKRGDDGGIHTAGEAADHMATADLIANAGADGIGKVGHLPIAGALAGVKEEVADEVAAVGGVGDFGVELHTDEGALAGAGADCGVRAGGGGGDDFEIGFVQFRHLIAVTHPDGGVTGHTVEEAAAGGAAGGDIDLSAAELAMTAATDGGPEHLTGQLHAVADAQDGDTEIKDGGVDLRRALVIDAGGAAGEDDAAGVQLGDLGGGHAGRDEHGKDAALADTPGDELGGLAAEVHDGDDLRASGGSGEGTGEGCRQRTHVHYPPFGGAPKGTVGTQDGTWTKSKWAIDKAVQRRGAPNGSRRTP